MGAPQPRPGLRECFLFLLAPFFPYTDFMESPEKDGFLEDFP
jgi:hypothetical protein